MSNIPSTLDTAVYRKLVLQLLNSLVAGGGGGSGTTNPNVAVASDGVTRSPLNLDSGGRLIVDIGSSIQLDNITVNTDQVENKQDTTNALLTTIQSDLVAPLPLPTGAATSALQTSGNSSLSTIATNTGNIPSPVSGRVPVDGSGVTQPVSASALPLPTGAATSANQTTANSSLSTIATNTNNLDVALSTRLKPADTLAGVTAVGSITNALPAGTNVIGGVTLPKASTASRSAFTASSDTQIAAASTSRQSISIFNVGPAILYIGFGSTAVSTSDFTYKLNPADTYVANTNEIGLEHRGIFAASGSTANVTIGS